MRPWVLAETNYAEVSGDPCEVAVLPMGATEPHNLHLPYGTDTFQVEVLAERACASAWELGANVVMLPAIPYGSETNMAKCAFAMNVNPSTLGLLIGDLVDSLTGHGVKKLLILNGHGGNEFKPVIRELMGRSPMQLFLCDWFRGLSSDVQAQIFEDPGDHAGEMETSLGLAFFAHLVQRTADGSLRADAGAVKESRFDAVQQGWVSISRPWHLLTSNTGVGNPHPATEAKGQQLMDVMVERLAGFLVELASAEVDSQFPF